MRDTSVADTAEKLLRNGYPERAIDHIHNSIENLMLDGKIRKVDLILRDINPNQYSVDVLISLLTATLPDKSKLGQRAGFYNRVEKSFEKLLKGLK
jgi:hypothetical protein